MCQYVERQWTVHESATNSLLAINYPTNMPKRGGKEDIVVPTAKKTTIPLMMSLDHSATYGTSSIGHN
jgi:hypothetical protein